VLAIVVVAAWSILACRRPVEEQASKEDTDLEVVDVDEPIDSQIRPEDDERAQLRDRGLLGVLPGDFLKDLWPYEPASIVDFGAAEAGRSYVSFRTLGSPQEVSRRFSAQERARGWQVTAPASTLLTFTKDSRLVEAELEQRGNETWIRIEYPTGG
jgi:hypothetical protein